MSLNRTQQGYLFLVLANVVWGLSPIYFMLVNGIPAHEVVVHRVIWSFLFMLCLTTGLGRWAQLKQDIKVNRRVVWLIFSALVIAANWLCYIAAVTSGQMLKASMGYFIAPLLSMLIGLLFFKERFNRTEMLALGLASVAILIQIVKLGTLPMISMSLAITLNLYTVLRKKIDIDAQSGMFIETGCLFPFAIAYLYFFNSIPSLQLHSGLLLSLSAIGVITTLPLLFYTAAAIRLPLSILGFFQYIAPSLTFILAIFIYEESIDYYDLASFITVWVGLILMITQRLKKQ